MATCRARDSLSMKIDTFDGRKVDVCQRTNRCTLAMCRSTMMNRMSMNGHRSWIWSISCCCCASFRLWTRQRIFNEPVRVEWFSRDLSIDVTKQMITCVQTMSQHYSTVEILARRNNHMPDIAVRCSYSAIEDKERDCYWEIFPLFHVRLLSTNHSFVD
jgi:hypothetical protein